MAFFRGLMVPISFLLFLALFGATALAVIAAGPILLDGLAPDRLITLLPAPPGPPAPGAPPAPPPSPWFVAAVIALVVDLIVAMGAMLISERVRTIRGFLGRVLRTTLILGILGAAGLAVMLSGQGASDLAGYLPALLLLAGLAAAAVVSSLVLGLPFLWWVSERPREGRAGRTHAPAVTVEPLPAAAPAAAVPAAEPAAPPVPVPAAVQSATASTAPHPVPVGPTHMPTIAAPAGPAVATLAAPQPVPPHDGPHRD